MSHHKTGLAANHNRKTAAEHIIRVDRTTPPTYPAFMAKLLHQELELTGPSEYELSVEHIELEFHDELILRKKWHGQHVYDLLVKEEALKNCFSLLDLIEIQKGGVGPFLEKPKGIFHWKIIAGWKSVIEHRKGTLRVPCLYQFDQEVVLTWFLLSDKDKFCTPRFISQ